MKNDYSVWRKAAAFFSGSAANIHLRTFQLARRIMVSTIAGLLIQTLPSPAFDEYRLLSQITDPPTLGIVTRAEANPSQPGGGGSVPSSTLATSGSNNLWLEISGHSNDATSLTVNGTTAEDLYEILTRETLANGGWLPEQIVDGSLDQTWTRITVPNANRTNALFFRVRNFSQDSDDDGLPDWWEREHGLDPDNADTGDTGTPDSYKDADSDGWTVLEELQNDMSPAVFNTPPAPTGVAAWYNGTPTSVILRWNTSPGPVIGYTIEREISEVWRLDTFEVAAGQTSLADDPFPLANPTPWFSPPTYRVRARYSLGDSLWSDPAPLFNEDVLFLDENENPAAIIRGPGGRIYAAVCGVPTHTASLQLTRYDYTSWPDVPVTHFTVPLASFTNGIWQLPEAWAGSFNSGFYEWWIKALDAGEQIIEVLGGGFTPSTIPFVDARQPLKQNLIFLLRAANTNAPFEFSWVRSDSSSHTSFRAPADYVYSGFDDFSEPGFAWFPDREWVPFAYNYLYRNFTFSPSDANSAGRLTNGASGPSTAGHMTLLYPSKYLFEPTTNLAQVTPILSLNESRWTYFHPAEISEDKSRIGLKLVSSNWQMANNASNYFGLPYLSVKNAYFSNGISVVNAGGSIPAHGGYFYPEAAQPDLVPDGYYFTSLLHWYPLAPACSPLPGQPDFSITNTSPMLITGIGAPFFHAAAYARYRIANGRTNRFGYVAQYFDRALRIDANGLVTTNETGVLSPYGEFFPTEPGPVALITMPDIDPPYQRGTGVLHVIKLQLDANHNGEMDLRFNGPDFTWEARPMRFWVNDDRDVRANSSDPTGHDARLGNLKACDFRDDYIGSWRDLEDFARLWICGLPKLPPSNGYSIRLSMAVLSGNPAINLYAMFHTNDSAGYLSDTNAARAQFTRVFVNDLLIFDHSRKLQTIDASRSYILPVSTDGTPHHTNFLFEAAGVGVGKLTLTIAQIDSQQSNFVAETSAYVEFRRVRDFYERSVITNRYSPLITERRGGIAGIQPATFSALGDERDVVVLIHGINVSVSTWLTESDTAFKRLYWAGFRGKFASVKWPCEFFKPWTFLSTDTSVFNRSEFQAYSASGALEAYLSQLHTRFPDHRLHLLAHSQGNSVASEAIVQGWVSVDTYILTQGAVPGSAYDASAPTDPALLTAEFVYPTPEWAPYGYRGVYTNLPGRIVNFYNPYDPVLEIWMLDQEFAKPDGYFKHLTTPTDYYTYNGISGRYWPLIGLPRPVWAPRESRAMVSRSRTESVGRQGPASGHGAINSGVDLNVEFGFDNNFPEDHSAQWVWPIQTTAPYFQELLLHIRPAL